MNELLLLHENDFSYLIHRMIKCSRAEEPWNLVAHDFIREETKLSSSGPRSVKSDTRVLLFVMR